MNCYKCNSEKELSAKKISSEGVITFICKSCRRAAYHRTKPVTQKYVPVDKNWIAKAKEKNGQIALKYRNNAFLEAKGLL